MGNLADKINDLADQIERVDECAVLRKLAKEAIEELNKQLDSVNSQMQILKPIADLLENPAADLVKIASWIGDFINGVLKPMYEPVIELEKQVVELTEAIARITLAVESKASELPSCILSL